MKYCKHCGEKVRKEAVVCVHCGCQIEMLAQSRAYCNYSNKMTMYNAKNKWVAFGLCLVFGLVGAHKMYEGKVFMSIVYILTCGLFGIGWLIDLISILFKPNLYYV